MVQVTETYLEAMAAQMRDRSYASIYVGQFDDTAPGDASLTSNGCASYGNLPLVNSERAVTQSYSTWSGPGLRGDGKQRVLPSSGGYYDQGFVGTALSGADGVFASPPYIDVRFSRQHTMIGLTLTFDIVAHECPAQVTFISYRGGAQIGSKTVSDLSPFARPELFLYDTDHIRIRFDKTRLPYQNVVLHKMLFGIGYEYTDEDIVSFEISESISPLSLSLPQQKLTFKLKNLNKMFNPEFTNSRTYFLSMEQEIKVQSGITTKAGIEYIPSGTWYLRSWDTKGIEATFTAGTILDRLSELEFEKDYWDANASLGDKLVAIIRDSGVSPDRFSYPDDAFDIKNNLPIPLGKHSAGIQLIANAGGYQMRIDRYGRLVLFRAAAEDKFTFNSGYPNTAYSSIEHIASGSATVYASWEKDFFRGDGSQRILPAAGGYINNGWVSELCATASGQGVGIVATTMSNLSTSVFSIRLTFGTAPPARVRFYQNVGTMASPVWEQRGTYAVKENEQIFPVFMFHVRQWRVDLLEPQKYPRRYHVNNVATSYVSNFFVEERQVFHPMYSEKPTRIARISAEYSSATLAAERSEITSTEVTENGLVKLRHEPAAHQQVTVEMAGVNVRIEPYLNVTYCTVSGLPPGQKTRVTITGHELVLSNYLKEEKLFDTGDSMPMENPLYTPAGIGMVMDWSRKYALNQIQQEIEMRGFPELEVGDYIHLEDGSPGVIIDRKLKYNGAFRDKFTVRRGVYNALG